MNGCDEAIRPALQEAFATEAKIESADENGCLVTLPFQRPDLDSITLLITQSENGYIISDEGRTFGMLYVLNVDISAETRKSRMKSIKELYDLDRAKYEIRLRANEKELGTRIRDAIQAVQAISYLTYTRKSYSKNEFSDIVSAFLDKRGVDHERNDEVMGDVGKHIIDIRIRGDDPIYIQTVSADSMSQARTKARRTALAWDDIFDKDPSIKRISVLDDERVADEEVDRLLFKYSDNYIPWSDKEELIGVV
ncbi:DUF1828 domain-containing protein [Halorussus halophilus]|uniref:DUF1828 domain-containing protein n=1 Tax=Halorussus halophilus TaxID=2650975 RepID=UPI001300DDC7|nr:DUF1828 domain-containing protein [Halorussus halophilus]